MSGNNINTQALRLLFSSFASDESNAQAVLAELAKATMFDVLSSRYTENERQPFFVMTTDCPLSSLWSFRKSGGKVVVSQSFAY